ncbi:MAG: hypothetical protein C0407_11285 [Desulfobacca sp.]|nr:hypothetical protein [Desulfobacca sp.]
MKWITAVCNLMIIVLVICFVGVRPAVPQSTARLVVNMTGLPSSDGFAKVALHNSEASYKGETEGGAFATGQAKVVDLRAKWIFENVPYGTYGISFFHDENGNGVLDKNLMGIPKEAYGFSNNVKGLFGKPDYKEITFKIDSPEKEITIKLK